MNNSQGCILLLQYMRSAWMVGTLQHAVFCNIIKQKIHRNCHYAIKKCWTTVSHHSPLLSTNHNTIILPGSGIQCFLGKHILLFVSAAFLWHHSLSCYGRHLALTLSEETKALHTYIHPCRPRWSRGNVLASRSKVRMFKPGWGRWIFSGRKNPEHKSSGRDFMLRVPSLRFQAC